MSDPTDPLAATARSLAALSAVPNQMALVAGASVLGSVAEAVRDRPASEVMYAAVTALPRLESEALKLALATQTGWNRMALEVIKNKPLRDALDECAWTRLRHMPTYFVAYMEGLADALYEAIFGTVRDLAFAGLWTAKLVGCLAIEDLSATANAVGAGRLPDAIAQTETCGALRAQLAELDTFASDAAQLGLEAAAEAGVLVTQPIEVLRALNEIVPLFQELVGAFATDAFADYMKRLAADPAALGKFEGKVGGTLIGLFVPGLDSLVLGRLMKGAGVAGAAAAAVTMVPRGFTPRVRTPVRAVEGLPQEVVDVLRHFAQLLKNRGMRNSLNITADKLKLVRRSKALALLIEANRALLINRAGTLLNKVRGSIASHAVNAATAAESNSLWKLLAYFDDADRGLDPNKLKELRIIASQIKRELAECFLEAAHLVDARWFKAYKSSFAKLGWASEAEMATILISAADHRIPFTRYIEAMFAKELGGARLTAQELERMSTITSDMLGRIIHADALAKLEAARKTPLKRDNLGGLLFVHGDKGAKIFVVVPPGAKLPTGFPGGAAPTKASELLMMHREIWVTSEAMVRDGEKAVAALDGFIAKLKALGL